MSRVSTQARRKWSLLMALATLSQPTINQLNKKVDIPVPTIRRYIAQLRTEYGMNIQYVKAGEDSYYRIMDWGIIDRNEFLYKAPSLIQNHKGMQG